MARIKTFLYCENIENQITPVGPKTSLNGPLAALRPVFIPGMFSFSIFMSMEDVELETSHRFKIIFKHEETGEVIIDTGDGEIPSQNVEGNLPKEIRGIMLNMDFRNVILRNEGYYVSEIYFDGEPIGEFPIYAKALEGK